MYLPKRKNLANLCLLLGMALLAFSEILHPYLHGSHLHRHDCTRPSVAAEGDSFRFSDTVRIHTHYAGLCPICNGMLTVENFVPPEFRRQNEYPVYRIVPFSLLPFFVRITKSSRAPPVC